MSISQLQIFNLSYPFVELAQEIDVATLQELERIAERLIEEPNANFEQAIRQVSDEQSTKFVSECQSLVEERLATAYLIGLTAFDEELNEMLENPKNEGNDLPNPLFSDKVISFGVASEIARQKLKDYPQHQELYAQYEMMFKEKISRFKSPYMESSAKYYRELAKKAMDPDFINGNKATRIYLSQRILNEFADKGIKTVDFPSGHRMSVEAFAEREARSYIGDVSLQGNVARATERGYNLVRISQYAGASPMCAPHQGNVYSLNGSDKYPPFSEALFDGSWSYGAGIRHFYCGHTTSSYIPGVSEGLGSLSNDPTERRILNEMGEAKGNRFIFNAEQQQRRVERQIRKYKRREAVALTDSERRRSQQLVRNWQARQRNWIEEHPFLRRQYKREQI